MTDIQKILAASRPMTLAGAPAGFLFATIILTIFSVAFSETVMTVLWKVFSWRVPARPGPAAVVLSAAGSPAAGHRRRGAGADAGVGGDGQGPETPGFRLRRTDHRLRADAGVRARQRPPGGLLGAMSIDFARLSDGPDRPPHEWLRELRPHERAPADRPFLYLNFVASVDGRAQYEGRTQGLGSDADSRNAERSTPS